MQTGALRSKAWRMLARLGKATLAAAAALLVAILLTEFYRLSSLPFQTVKIQCSIKSNENSVV